MASNTAYLEDEPNPTDQNLHSLPFNYVFEPSNPIGFLESAINFASYHSDLLKIDSLEETMVSLVLSAKEKVSMEEEAKKKPEAEASAEDFAEGEEKRKLLVPNSRNGADMDDYSWGQSLLEVTVTVPVPQGTNSKLILCEIKKDHLKVGLKGEKPIIDGKIFESVKPDDCFWNLEDSKIISILMTKMMGDYWNSLLKGGLEIDCQKFKLDPSELRDLDSETRSGVERALFDQMQKKQGLPTSKEIKIQELKKSKAKNPNMDIPGGK